MPAAHYLGVHIACHGFCAALASPGDRAIGIADGDTSRLFVPLYGRFTATADQRSKWLLDQ
ncbi:hypothetical protein [Nitrosospira multiformis]|uniref:hypothetical protein n=1 Tax=Nitrosospira multiformis TaxID=1231 RepID=UPI0015E1D8BF|nr:hypothetical protein [Nitrosospira multiformis]